MAPAPLDLVAELKSLAALLDGAHVPYALCGGMAVTVHGAVRSTKDIDLLVRDTDVERVVELVRPAGWRFRALPMVFDPGEPHARHLTRVTRIEGPLVLMLDLIAVTPFLQPVFDGRIVIEVGGQPLSVVSLDGLAVMKRLAGRPQDLADLEKLGVEP